MFGFASRSVTVAPAQMVQAFKEIHLYSVLRPDLLVQKAQCYAQSTVPQ